MSEPPSSLSTSPTPPPAITLLELFLGFAKISVSGSA
jgi:hypothetical protein